MDSGVQFSDTQVAQNVNTSNGDFDSYSYSSGGAVEHSNSTHDTSVLNTSYQELQFTGSWCRYPNSSFAVADHVSSPGYMDVVDPLTRYK